jgi:hypothetical protein
MKYFIKEFQNMLKSLEKVMTMPRKIYDCEGKLTGEVEDSKIYDTWLSSACKSGDFCQAVKYKYETYFKGKKEI